MTAVEYAHKAEEALEHAWAAERGSYARRDQIQAAQVYAQLATAVAIAEAQQVGGGSLAQ